jgi:hypothetical protein
VLHLTFCLLVVVTVHILAKQSNLLNALISKQLHLVNDGVRRSVSFSPANKWNNAKTTHVVAAPHDANPGMQLVGRPDWKYVSISFVLAELYVHCCRILIVD